MARSFDIPVAQVVLHCLADPYPWHGRILCERTEGSTWIGLSPDLDDGPQPVDLAHKTYELLDRNAPIPNRFVVAGVYLFGPIDATEFRRLRRAAIVHAALLGADDVAMLRFRPEQRDPPTWILFSRRWPSPKA